MTTELLNDLAERAIQVYLDWLNLWADENALVTRADCDEYSDPPRLLNDWISANGLGVNRTMTILVNPYHDEGGPTQLTAWFSNYTTDHDSWRLDAIDQLFDTCHQYIFVREFLADDDMEDLPLPVELDEGTRPADTQVTAALAAKAREIWDQEDPEGLQEFLLMLGSCYNELSPYNDYDLDIDL